MRFALICLGVNSQELTSEASKAPLLAKASVSALSEGGLGVGKQQIKANPRVEFKALDCFTNKA